MITRVQKRSGDFEEVSFDKITQKIKELSHGLKVDPISIAQKVCNRIYDGVTTSELDDITAELCITLAVRSIDFRTLASRIVIDNHSKCTSPSFLEVSEKLYSNVDKLGESSPLINETYMSTVRQYSSELEKMIDYKRDFNIDYFGMKTLQKAYLYKDSSKKIIERPQHMWMRVAIAIHGDDLSKVRETYDFLSLGYFTHATPTLFHAGSKFQQLSSCFLLGTEDSVNGIFENISACANISKWAGGIGLHVSNIRAKGSYIRSTAGTSNGLLDMLRVYNDVARYINQSGKRNGSFAIYLEPWHADIYEFLEAKKNHGNTEERARDLFYGMWIPDIFMRKVQNDEEWYLMCPDMCKGLSDSYGKEFDSLYEKFVQDGNYIKKVKAREVWNRILSSQIETGTPYMVYKDACNEKSNQNNLGVIKSSNLCTEIIEYSDSNEYAVCNLASINLSNFVEIKETDLSELIVYTKDNCEWCTVAKGLLNSKNISFTERKVEGKISEEYMFGKKYSTVPQIFENTGTNIGGYTELWELLKPVFNFDKLREVTSCVARNLDKIIDINYYPLDKCEISNKKHRPIGIGVQGLADVFVKMRMSFGSIESRILNYNIFEVMYHSSIKTSCELAQELGRYSSFENSEMSKGNFQYDLWEKRGETVPENLKTSSLVSDSEWNDLKEQVKTHGLRNSLSLAPMPTASTSQILGNNECIEPFTSNMYTRRTLAGEFPVVNKHLIKDLREIGVFNDEISEQLMYFNGSVKNIAGIPRLFKEIYKTAWEIPQKNLIDLAADRGRFICQSQSLNLFFENPNFDLLTKAHFYGWKRGLKTGSYYIHSKPAVLSQKFTIDPNKELVYKKNAAESEDDDGSKVCEMCSS